MQATRTIYNKVEMKPRIAIPVPTSTDLAYNSQNWQAYADAVLASGGDPVRFSLGLTRSEATTEVNSCQGIVLPGSPADVSPGKYGHRREEASAQADLMREKMDELLLESAHLTSKPMLAICFGMQMLNVIHGGTLIQDVTILPVNHGAGRSVAVAHTIILADGSLLAGIASRDEAQNTAGASRLPVNSSHHQAVGVAGNGLRVSARCPQDGIVEAVELSEPGPQFLLGVQWHPERTFHFSTTSRAIFSRLIQEATAWQSAEVLAAV